MELFLVERFRETQLLYKSHHLVKKGSFRRVLMRMGGRGLQKPEGNGLGQFYEEDIRWLSRTKERAFHASLGVGLGVFQSNLGTLCGLSL